LGYNPLSPHISAKTSVLVTRVLSPRIAIVSIVIAALAALSVLCVGVNSAVAQAAGPLVLSPDKLPGRAPASDLRIDWEVKNRFRLFRSDEDFQRHVAAHRGDGVLAAERRLSIASDGRGWARDMVDRLCVDQTGRLPDVCQRDGVRENYLAPEDHAVAVILAGTLPPNATCAWTFDDGEGAPRQAAMPCEEDVRLRVAHGRPTIASVTVTSPNGGERQANVEIAVRDLLIAGLGDSVAAGEGNPDRPVALDDGGFCFRRFLGGATSEYFRPGRAGFRGDKSCEPVAAGASGNSAADWARFNARWWSAACHRSLYGYQVRAALALAVENPHVAVTFLPLACSGSTIDLGFFNPLRARECPPAGPCAGTTIPQVTRLQEALALARRRDPERKLDLALLTIGANDIWFAGLVADVIVEAATERALFEKGGMIMGVPEAQAILDKTMPADFAKVRAALKPAIGGNLARVVFVNYPNPALAGPGEVCGGGRAGFDVHPAFNADPARLRKVADFVSSRFLPRMKALATCEAGGACRDPSTERMTFVDAHQAEFAEHGFCARAENDPIFDRECFSAKGESFASNPAAAATDPLVCNRRPSDFRPYASRARWVRTANDSYFTAMTFPEGLSPTLQPSDLHDATWGATSAVYGGAIHPTAEGHAAMADAVLPAMRGLLSMPAISAVRAEPLPPPVQQ
jgi:hypothetical protein